jgi:transcriptional regulator with XRE-family HTH domain
MEDMAARGVDVLELARRTGKHHVTIRRFLSGEAQTIRVAAAIAQALGEKPDRYLKAVKEVA